MVGQAVKARAAARHQAPVSVDDMKELLRTNDPVRLSWAQAMLAEAGIESLVLDQHTSIVEGSIGAIQRRLMVGERDWRRARALLAESGDAAR